MFDHHRLEEERNRHATARRKRCLHVLVNGAVKVLGGTAWLWSRPEFASAVDVLFVDEAGQMSLANVLTSSPAGRSLVLLGDPQQLEQPQKGSHPEGSDISALAHLLNGKLTIGEDQGLFLAKTWRLHPGICSLTSELFYEGRLVSLEGLDRQQVEVSLPFSGAGLWYLPVAHEGNQSYAAEEVDHVVSLVQFMTKPGSTWVDRHGERRPLNARRRADRGSVQ